MSAHSLSPAKVARDGWVVALVILVALGAIALLLFTPVDQHIGYMILFVAAFTYMLYLTRKTGEIAGTTHAVARVTQDLAQAAVQAAAVSQGMMAELRATRDAQLAPYVVLSLEVQDHVVRLVMENLGQSVAHNITLAWEAAPSRDLIGGRAWAAFMTAPTPTLAPRQRLVAAWGSFSEIAQHPALQQQYHVTVRYTGDNVAVQYQGTDVLDFAALAGSEVAHQQQSDALFARLDGIAQALGGTMKLLQQSHSQMVNQLGDLTHALEGSADAARAGQSQMLGTLQGITQAVTESVASANHTQVQVLDSLTGISQAVAGTMETVNRAQDQLADGLLTLAANRSTPEKAAPEQAVQQFGSLVRQLDGNWRKWQELRRAGNTTGAFAQPQMRQWVEGIIAIAPTLPAAPIVIERLSGVALRLLNALNAAPADSAARNDIPTAIAELAEIAGTFPSAEESFLL
ncbi:MAG: hypothetical protein H0X24_25635 [Ktedonobacterales bacterium]|nr:hypothetical protein [Ktedonobacterales bacterium]